MAENIKCTKCGEEKPLIGYWKSYSPLHENTGYVPTCKTCIYAMYSDFIKKGLSKKDSFIEICKLLDKPFINNVFENVIKSNENETPEKLLGEFFKQVHMQQWRKKGFYRFEDSEIEKKDTTNMAKEIKELSKEDILVKEDVIRLMGYDPFDGYGLFDQKFLYNELMPYLDEDTIDDSFKLSQIIQIVNNNNQVRKIDLAINQMSSNIADLIKNQTDIKSATAIKNQIVTSNDKIAKENSISVKNRGDKSAGKSTLTYLMRNYRELGFQDAEQDYYDENKAKGMQMVADISNKSIIQQLQLDENDINDMLFTQRQLIQELQSKVDDLEEENRQLYVQITELKTSKEV